MYCLEDAKKVFVSPLVFTQQEELEFSGDEPALSKTHDVIHCGETNDGCDVRGAVLPSNGHVDRKSGIF